jgi:exodeoxyribonuclease VII large subunit
MSANPQPTQYGDRSVYTVAGFNQGVGGWLQRLPEVWVEGEIAELKQQGRWAYAYMTLKDPSDGSCLPALIARARLDAIDPPLRPGDRVHARGRAEMYAKKGELRFRVSAIEQFGLGLVLRQIEELKTRLAGEGLFAAERKRPLPMLPRVVGLICGTDAAAKRDVMETASVRYPPARFRVIEAAVQGPGAVPQILAALERLDRDDEVDVIVLARGGGSFEDLLPFSDERLVRAVAACATPVVSAIGHEQDTPIVDHAADLRAGTPSLAAKLVVPDFAVLTAELEAIASRAGRALRGRADRCRESLAMLVSRPAFADPRSWITVRRESLLLVRDGLDRWPLHRLDRERTRLAHARDRLTLLGPAATLERGYAIVQQDGGAVVTDAAAVAPGDRVAVRLSHGRIAARVEGVDEE